MLAICSWQKLEYKLGWTMNDTTVDMYGRTSLLFSAGKYAMPRDLQLEFAKAYGSLGIWWSFVWSHSCGSKKQIPQHRRVQSFHVWLPPEAVVLLNIQAQRVHVLSRIWALTILVTGRKLQWWLFPYHFFCLAKACISVSNGGSTSYFSFPVLRVTIMQSV